MKATGSYEVEVRERFYCEFDASERAGYREGKVFDTYEEAVDHGCLVLASTPSVRRFTIHKWTERVDTTEGNN